MKKKLFSILLSLAMVITMMPAMALTIFADAAYVQYLKADGTYGTVSDYTKLSEETYDEPISLGEEGVTKWYVITGEGYHDFNEICTLSGDANLIIETGEEHTALFKKGIDLNGHDLNIYAQTNIPYTRDNNIKNLLYNSLESSSITIGSTNPPDTLDYNYAVDSSSESTITINSGTVKILGRFSNELHKFPNGKALSDNVNLVINNGNITVQSGQYEVRNSENYEKEKTTADEKLLDVGGKSITINDCVSSLFARSRWHFSDGEGTVDNRYGNPFTTQNLPNVTKADMKPYIYNSTNGVFQLYTGNLTENVDLYFMKNSTRANVEWNRLQFLINNADDEVETDIVLTTDATQVTSPSADAYYDLLDMGAYSTLYIPKDKIIKLDLNGHVLNRGLVSADGTIVNNDYGSVIDIDGELTIIDNGSTVPHTGFVDTNGIWHIGEGTGESKTIKGGIITGGAGKFYDDEDEYNGCGIYINGTGKLTLNAGNICGNTFDNNFKSAGGGILNDGNFIMNGGTICNNVGYWGGGVINYETFIMNGGQIIDNASVWTGGGVQNQSSCTFTMTNGIISGNKSQYGGGIWSYGRLELLAGKDKCIKIDKNIATKSKGGVFCGDEGASTYFSGKIIIKDNICEYTYTDSGTTVKNPANMVSDWKYAPINIVGSLSGSEIYCAISDNDDDKQHTGALTSAESQYKLDNKWNNIFHYDGPSIYYMDLSADGELWVKEVPENNYAISIPSFPNGKVTVDKLIASAGAIITLTVTPNSGFELSANSLKVTSADGTEIPVTGSGNTYTFTMPSSAVTVTAEFKEKSGGGGETTDEPKPGDPTNVDVSKEVKVEKSTETGQVEANVDLTSKVSDIVKNVTETQSKEVIIDAVAKTTEEVDKADVIIPAKLFEDLSNVPSVENIVIQTNVAELTFDKETAKEIATQSPDGAVITVEAIREDEESTKLSQDVYELKVIAKTATGKQIISNFKGGKVTVKVDIPTGLTGKKVACLYRSDKGVYTRRSVTNQNDKDGWFSFTTNHFSDYVVTEESTAQKLLVNQVKPTQNKLKAYKGKKVRVSFKRATWDKELDKKVTVYQIYRSTKAKKGFKKVKTLTYKKKATTIKYYNKKGLKKGKKYYYKVRGRVKLSNGKYAYTKWSSVRSVRCK